MLQIQLEGRFSNSLKPVVNSLKADEKLYNLNRVSSRHSKEVIFHSEAV